MNLKCHKCGLEKEYPDKRSAFADGWDFVSMNGIDAEFCGDCPSGPFVIEQTKAKKESI